MPSERVPVISDPVKSVPGKKGKKAPLGRSGHPTRKRGWLRSVAIGVLAAILTILAGRTDLFRTFELKTLDARFRLRGSRPPSAPLAIVFIGDDSIDAIGRWPWSWEYHALLVDVLQRAGARRVLFDIFFTESPGKGEEGLLAGMAELSGSVYLCSFFQSLNPGKEGGWFSLQGGVSLNEPVPALKSAAAGVGHCNAPPDLDGSTRGIPLLVMDGERPYPSAPFLAALGTSGASPEMIALSPEGDIVLPGPDGTTLSIPVEEDGRTLVNFLGGVDSFPSYSFSQVLQADRYPDRGVVDLSLFRDRIVLVGATFTGSNELRPTAFSPAYPMVAVQATVIDNILSGNFIHTPPPFPFLVFWLFLGAFIGTLAFLFRPLTSLGATFLAGGAYGGLSIAAFSLGDWYFQLVGPMTAVVATYVLVTAMKHFVDERKAREVRAMFSSYVTERVVNELTSNPDLARLGGERREVTVLFADLRGFTTYSVKHSAEEVVSVLNEYLAEMTDVIFHWEGTLDKFIGDAIVAFWGAPLAQEDHAERALRCSLHMIQRLEELQQKWRSEGKEPLRIGIGLNTGEVIVGNIGAEGKKMDYTVIGDHVNLGSRVESLNKKYKSHILMTEFTLENIRDAVASGRFGHLMIEGMERVVVKGRAEPVQVFQLLSREPGSETTISECGRSVFHQKEK